MFRRFKEKKLQDLGFRERTVNPEFDAKVERFTKTDAALTKVHKAAIEYAKALQALSSIGREFADSLNEFYTMSMSDTSQGAGR
jgi:hypothetical protein